MRLAAEAGAFEFAAAEFGAAAFHAGEAGHAHAAHTGHAAGHFAAAGGAAAEEAAGELGHGAFVFHEAAHHVELFDELIDFHDGAAGAVGNAFAAGAVEEVGFGAFGGGHGEDHCFDVLHAFVVYRTSEFLHFAHARDHAEDAFKGSELFHEAHLGEEVVEVELGFLKAFGHAEGLFFIDLFGGFFDEGDDVAHAEDALGHAVGVEDFELLDFFPNAEEFDGAAGDLTHGEEGAAAGVAIQFGHDEAGDADGFVEGFGDGDGLLAGGGVGDEEGLAGLDKGGDFFEFVDEGAVDVLSAGGVEDGDHGALLGEPFEGGFGGADGIDFAGCGGPDGGVEGIAEDLELLDGGGAIEVEGDEDGAFALFFEPVGELGGGGGFAGAVEADHEDALGGLQVQGRGAAAEDFDEFVVEDFDDLLAWGDGAEDFLAHGFGFDGFEEVFGDLEIDVGLEEGEADVLHGVGDIRLADAAEPAQFFEGVFEFVGEEREHGLKGRVD